jgi:hypothetical protein
MNPSAKMTQELRTIVASQKNNFARLKNVTSSLLQQDYRKFTIAAWVKIDTGSRNRKKLKRLVLSIKILRLIKQWRNKTEIIG